MVAASEVEELRQKNGEMEKAVEEMRKEMLQLWRRTQVAEEAEEHLCSQLAELEAESLDQARDYHSRIAAAARRSRFAKSTHARSGRELVRHHRFWRHQ